MATLSALLKVLASSDRDAILQTAREYGRTHSSSVDDIMDSNLYISKPFAQTLGNYIDDVEVIEAVVHSLSIIQVSLHEPSVYLDPVDIVDESSPEDGDCKQLVGLIQNMLAATKKHGSRREIVRDSALFIGDLMCSKAIQDSIDDAIAEHKAVQLFLELIDKHYKDDTDVTTKIAYLFSNLVTTSVRWCGVLLQRQAISAVVRLAKAQTTSFELVGMVCTILAQTGQSLRAEAFPKGLLSEATAMAMQSIEAAMERYRPGEDKKEKKKEEEETTGEENPFKEDDFKRFLECSTGFLSVLASNHISPLILPHATQRGGKGQLADDQSALLRKAKKEKMRMMDILLKISIKYPQFVKVTMHISAILALVSASELRTERNLGSPRVALSEGGGDDGSRGADDSNNVAVSNISSKDILCSIRLQIERYGPEGSAPLATFATDLVKYQADHATASSICWLLVDIVTLFKHLGDDASSEKEDAFLEYLIAHGIPLVLAFVEIHRSHFAVVESGIHFITRCCILKEMKTIGILRREDGHILMLQLLDMYQKSQHDLKIDESSLGDDSKAPTALIYYINFLLSNLTRDNLSRLSSSLGATNSSSSSKLTLKDREDMASFLIGVASADSMEILFSVVKNNFINAPISHRALAQISDTLIIAEDVLQVAGSSSTSSSTPGGSSEKKEPEDYKRGHWRNEDRSASLRSLFSGVQLFCRLTELLTGQAEGEGLNQESVISEALLAAMETTRKEGSKEISKTVFILGADAMRIVLMYLRCLQAYVVRRGEEAGKKPSRSRKATRTDIMKQTLNSALLLPSLDFTEVSAAVMVLARIVDAVMDICEEADRMYESENLPSHAKRATPSVGMFASESSEMDLSSASSAVLNSVAASVKEAGGGLKSSHALEDNAPNSAAAEAAATAPTAGATGQQEDEEGKGKRRRGHREKTKYLQPQPTFVDAPRPTPINNNDDRPSMLQLLDSVRQKTSRSSQVADSNKEPRGSRLSRLRLRRATAGGIRSWTQRGRRIPNKKLPPAPASFKRLKKVKLSVLKATTALQSAIQHVSIQLRRALSELKRKLRFSQNDHWKQWIEYKYKLEEQSGNGKQLLQGDESSLHSSSSSRSSSQAGSRVSLPGFASLRNPDIESIPTLEDFAKEALRYHEEDDDVRFDGSSSSPRPAAALDVKTAGAGESATDGFQTDQKDQTEDDFVTVSSIRSTDSTPRHMLGMGGLASIKEGAAGGGGGEISNGFHYTQSLSRRARTFTLTQLKLEYKKPRRFSTMSPEDTHVVETAAQMRGTGSTKIITTRGRIRRKFKRNRKGGPGSGTHHRHVIERRLSAQMPTGELDLRNWEERTIIRRQALALRAAISKRESHNVRAKQRQRPSQSKKSEPRTISNWEDVRMALEEDPCGDSPNLRAGVLALVRRRKENTRGGDAKTTTTTNVVPSDLRPRLWMALTGAERLRRKHVKGYYNVLVEEAVKKEHQNDLAHVTISKDVHRTLPKVKALKTEECIRKMHNILFAYAVRNPETVGYCQSMNLICAVSLLLENLDEENAFWMLCSVVEKHVGYYARSMCGLKVDQLVVSDLVAYFEPKLSDHMLGLGVTCDTFSVPWLLCLFVEQPVAFSEIAVIWDHLFLRGEEFIFQMVLAILHLKKDEIMAASQYEDLMHLLLRGMGKEMRSSTILHYVDEVMNKYIDKHSKMEEDKQGQNDDNKDDDDDASAAAAALFNRSGRASYSLEYSNANPFQSPPPHFYGSMSGDPLASLHAEQRVENLHGGGYGYGNETGGASSSSSSSPPTPASAASIRSSGIMERVARLRSFHQWDIANHSTSELESSTVVDLKRRFNTDDKEIHRLWKKFLSPSAWRILLQAGISSLDSFVKAFANEAFATWHRRQWRGHGLESGALLRLMEILDYNVTGQVNFEQYLFGIFVLTSADPDMRKRLAFEFCDMDADGLVSRLDLMKALKIIHRLYNGRNPASEDQQIEKFVEAMFEFALVKKDDNRRDDHRESAAGQGGEEEDRGGGRWSSITARYSSMHTNLDVEIKSATTTTTTTYGMPSNKKSRTPPKRTAHYQHSTKRRAFMERHRFRTLKFKLSPQEFCRAINQHPLMLLFFNLHDEGAEVRGLRSNLIAAEKGGEQFGMPF